MICDDCDTNYSDLLELVIMNDDIHTHIGSFNYEDDPYTISYKYEGIVKPRLKFDFCVEAVTVICPVCGEIYEEATKKYNKIRKDKGEV